MSSLTCSAFVEKADSLRFYGKLTRPPFAAWRPADGLILHFRNVEILTQVRDEMTKTIEEWRKHLEENR